MSSVYFIRAGQAGPIKIGVSTDPLFRMKQLQTARNEPLVLLATINGDMTTERVLHARFAELRIRKTEWFAPGRNLLSYIQGVIDGNHSGCRRCDARSHAQARESAPHAPRHVEVARAREGSAAVLAAIANAEEKDAAE